MIFSDKTVQILERNHLVVQENTWGIFQPLQKYSKETKAWIPDLRRQMIIGINVAFKENDSLEIAFKC